MRSCCWLLAALAACGDVGSKSTLTVELSGGSVTSTPAGITCPGTCSADFDFGEDITLTATPDATTSFTGWSDRCPAGRGACALSLDTADVTVTANFVPQGAKRWVLTAGLPQGVVEGVNVGAFGSSAVVAGTTGSPTSIGGVQITGEGVFLAGLDAGPGKVASVKSLVGDIRINSMLIDTTGATVIAGAFVNTVDFGGGPLTSTTDDSQDGFVAKYAADGAFQWVRPMTGPGSQATVAVGVDASGDVYVGGDFVETADFGGGSIAASPGGDMFVARYRAATGAYVWAKKFGGDNVDDLTGVSVDRGGSIVVVGSFTGTASFDREVLTSGTQSSSGALVKLEPGTGAVQFAKALGISATSVTIDLENNVLVGGLKPPDAGVGGPPVPGRAFIAKFSPAGAHIWSRGFAFAPDRIASDSLGDTVIGGAFADTFELGDGVAVTSAGNNDAFVAKLRGDTGMAVWAKRFGGTDSEGTRGLALDALDRIYVTGTYSGFSEFERETFTALGISDLFAIGLEP